MSATDALAFGVVGFAAVVSLSFLVLFDQDRPLVYRLTAEDALVEWSQAIGFLISAIGFAWLAICGYRSRVLCAGMSVVLFLVTGEEISWGQRLFGYKSPSAVTRFNVQGETNLHNLSPIHGWQRLASLTFIFTLSLAIPLLFRWVPTFREQLVQANAPVFPLWSNVLFGSAFLWMAVPRAFGAHPAVTGRGRDWRVVPRGRVRRHHGVAAHDGAGAGAAPTRARFAPSQHVGPRCVFAIQRARLIHR